MNIGLIGAGAVGRFLLENINKAGHERLQIKSIFVRNPEKYKTLETEFGVTLYTELDAFLDSGIDIVAEAATVEVVRELLPAILRKKDAVVISIGALVDKVLLDEVKNIAKEHNHTVHLPSGGIGGLDLVQNANALGTLTSASLTTRKPASSLIEEAVEEEKVVFEGSAAEAIRQFPKNVNVSIVLSLAGIGIEKTKMTLIADPEISKNIHQIDVAGDFGEASFTMTNNPLPANPKTSYLAAMSILATLERGESSIKIG